MKLKSKITADELSALQEPYKALYTAKDGAYLLTEIEPVDGYALENVTALKSALAKERQNAAAADDLKKRFEGLDVEQVLKAYDQFKDADKWTPVENVANMIEAKVRQVEQKYQGTIGEKDQYNSFLMKEIERVMVDSEVARATERRPGNPTAGAFALLIDKVRRHTRVEKGPDGKFRTVVVDDDGKTPRITTRQGSTDGMSISEFLATLKGDAEYSRAFDGPQSTGSGETGRLQNRNGTVQIDQSMAPEARIAAFRRMQQT